MEDAESNTKKHINQYGYYGDLSYYNGLLFRECILPQGKKITQVYKNDEYIGEIPDINNIIGYISPYYYIIGNTDLENELFSIKRITIDGKEVN